jgi:hypothetical protein
MPKQLKRVSKRRTPSKKQNRRKRNTGGDKYSRQVIELEDFYSAINKVQLARDPFAFLIREDDRAVYENILKDLELPYTSKCRPGKLLEYTVSPGKERPLQSDTEEVEEFPDEIAEDGQVFF